MAKTTTKIDSAAKDRLPWLCAAVKADFSVVANQDDVVSALVLGTTVPQLAGILLGYHKATAETPGTDPAA
jgi:hypothetical protein